MTKGTCSSCEKTTTKAAMTRHLAACGRSDTGPDALLVNVSARYAPADYWLHLEVPADARLDALDAYLRDLWLECCGHMSLFEVDRTETPMNRRIGSVLQPGGEARHLYDMGSTTELELRCLEERSGHPTGEIRLLARNAPPWIGCTECDASASAICTECSWEAAATLCEDCAVDHACDEELLLPLVNSPRAGVCGYTGA